MSYIIRNFLTSFQNYLFFRVIEKETKLLTLRTTDLHDLETNHLKMLDSIIRSGCIDNPVQNISRRIRSLLSVIHEFAGIVHRLASDDLPLYEHPEVHSKLKFIFEAVKTEQESIEALLLRPQ
jgi:hypothetical protein